MYIEVSLKGEPPPYLSLALALPPIDTIGVHLLPGSIQLRRCSVYKTDLGPISAIEALWCLSSCLEKESEEIDLRSMLLSIFACPEKGLTIPIQRVTTKRDLD